MAAFLVAVLTIASDPVTRGGFALQDGDRVVFYGDSITEARRYTSFVETYVLTRFPRLNVSFVHSGWRGDDVRGGEGGPIDVRLTRDVLAYEPSVMTIMLGMNDAGTRPFDQELFATYSAGYRHILDTVRRKRPGIRITLLEPSPYDDVTRPPDFEGGYNEVLVRYGAFVRELAHTENMTVADLNAPVVATLNRARALDPDAAAKLIPDRIHPSAQITLVMAQALLQAWNAPAIVTEVEIDAARKTAPVQVNTRVTDLQTTGRISWTQADQALPMPIDDRDPLMALVLRSSDFVKTLNRQPLKVRGLPPGRWTLRIDGQPVGTFPSDALASGINLAELRTPMARQAEQVHKLTNQHNGLRWTRWRAIQVPYADTDPAETRAALSALDALEASVVKRQRAAAQPQPRRFQLTPAPLEPPPGSPSN